MEGCVHSRCPAVCFLGEFKYSETSASCFSLQIGGHKTLSYEWTALSPYCSIKVRVNQWRDTTDRFSTSHYKPLFLLAWLSWSRFVTCRESVIRGKLHLNAMALSQPPSLSPNKQQARWSTLISLLMINNSLWFLITGDRFRNVFPWVGGSWLEHWSLPIIASRSHLCFNSAVCSVRFKIISKKQGWRLNDTERRSTSSAVLL